MKNSKLGKFQVRDGIQNIIPIMSRQDFKYKRCLAIIMSIDT